MGRILIVDLNNYARYPTLAIGYLVAPLRAAGHNVEVLSPLAIGAPPAEHEKVEDRREHLVRRINFATHPVMQAAHESLRRLHARREGRPHQPTLRAVAEHLDRDRPDVILLSAYLNHHPSVAEVAAAAASRGIPVLLGGPAFSSPDTIRSWLDVDGITAIFAGEADLVVADLVEALLDGDDLSSRPGVWIPGQPDGTILPPLHDLDRLPIPDFDDFPWHAYPNRIIPIMTGRGCGWGVCTFCSDVITTNGRGYRSRSLEAVLAELEHQGRCHHANDAIFLDLKLNSDLSVWHGLIENYQRVLPGGRWIATVHVDGKGENGLDAESLRAARAAGLTRISFGLETGSQDLARRMRKGTDLDRNQRFVEDAADAGISLRSTMIMGYPGETVDDLVLTRDFLARNQDRFDRIRPARFKAIPGTPFQRLLQERPERFKGLSEVEWDHHQARATYRYRPAADRDYRRHKREILDIVHRINAKPLRDDARQFDGLM